MPRRRVAGQRVILPDPKYKDGSVAKFINTLMQSGKKSIAERVMYGALDHVAPPHQEGPDRGIRGSARETFGPRSR